MDRLTKPPEAHTSLIDYLAAAFADIPVIGDVLEILTGIEDADLDDLGTWVNNLLDADGVNAQIADALGIMADALDMVPIVGSTLSEILDNIAAGINDVNATAIAAADAAAAAHDWASIFTEDFNRANGAVGNGWTVVGSQGQIVSNRYAITGSTDLGAGIVRDTGTALGKQRVKAKITSPSVSADCSLILCSNSAGTQGLAANIFNNKVFIARFSTSLAGNTTFTDLASNLSIGSNIVTGDDISFNVRNGTAWIERNGLTLLSATNVHAVVPATNQYAGARVEWASFNASGAWDDLILYI